MIPLVHFEILGPLSPFAGVDQSSILGHLHTKWMCCDPLSSLKCKSADTTISSSWPPKYFWLADVKWNGCDLFFQFKLQIPVPVSARVLMVVLCSVLDLNTEEIRDFWLYIDNAESFPVVTCFWPVLLVILCLKLLGRSDLTQFVSIMQRAVMLN